MSKASGGVMQHTGGRLLIGAIGIVVISVGIGFAAYGAFCVVTFPHRRLEAAS